MKGLLKLSKVGNMTQRPVPLVYMWNVMYCNNINIIGFKEHVHN